MTNYTDKLVETDIVEAIVAQMLYDLDNYMDGDDTPEGYAEMLAEEYRDMVRTAKRIAIERYKAEAAAAEAEFNEERRAERRAA